MAVAPLFFVLYQRVVAPRYAPKPGAAGPSDAIEHGERSVIIAGFGRFGHIVGRVLQVNGFEATVLDLDPTQVDTIRRLGMKVFYGDATRLELLQAAGAARARLFVLAIDDEERSLVLAETVRKHFPNLTILARAVGRIHAYRLLRVGVTSIYRETLDSSLAMSVEALRRLGVRGYEATRAARRFRDHDERAVRALADLWDKDEEIYFSEARRQVVAVEQMFSQDRRELHGERDEAWDPPGQKKEA
jgi:voltage-gated potassium channel Kch